MEKILFFTGGLVGATHNTSINYCHNNGNITGYREVGGLVGRAYNSTIKSSYNSGNITADYWAGGLVGYFEVEDSNFAMIACYNSGGIQPVSIAGGLIGVAESDLLTIDKMDIIACYNVEANNLTDPDNGACIGEIDCRITIKDTFYKGSYSDQSYGKDSNISYVNGGFEHKSEDELKSEDLLNTLNKCSSNYNASNPYEDPLCAWKRGDDGYPTLDFDKISAEYASTEIHDALDLITFANRVNNGDNTLDAKLMCNIDLNGSESNPWTPIGDGENASEAYAGVFDGNGYTISGLYVKGGTSNGQGLFGSVYGGTIKNLTVDGEVNSDYSNAAGIAGYARAAIIDNCTNLANVSGTKYAGGIVGYCSPTYGTRIKRCINKGTIYSSGDFAGGIVGKINNESDYMTNTVIYCANKGDVSAVKSYVGGIAGTNQGGKIRHCYNRGEIHGGENVGGLVGSNEVTPTGYIPFYAYLFYSYSIAKVTGNSDTTGLVAGFRDSSSIQYCYYDESLGGKSIGIEEQPVWVSATTFPYESCEGLVETLNGKELIDEELDSIARWVAGADGYPAFDFEK